MTHLVNSLQFHLTCRDEWLAFNLRQNFAHTLQDQIAEIIDRVCSEQVGEQESVRIERIQVDMGTFTAHALSSSFRPVFLQKFEQALTEQLSKIPPTSVKTSAASPEEDLLEYFLQYGRLPWWTSGTDFDPATISAALIQEPDNRLKQFFTKNKTSAAIWARAAWQLNDTAKNRLIALFDELAAAQQTFTVWRGELEPAAGNDQPGSGTQATVQTWILLHAPDIFNADGQAPALWKLFSLHAPELVQPANKEASTQLNNQLRSIATKNNWPLEAAKPAASPAAVTGITAATTDPEIRYTTQHAGLMLLMPFLKQLFTQLGLWSDQEWTSRDAQFKAVHLLQYLATGELTPPEYTLTLEKICCGLAVSMPVPLSVTLEETDINEATSLLQSVIEHWKSLKHTSVSGLRETFLKREGILTKKDNDWLLRIERKTVDVLLDNIPWGFAIARQPWSREVIFVEW